MGRTGPGAQSGVYDCRVTEGIIEVYRRISAIIKFMLEARNTADDVRLIRYCFMRSRAVAA